MGSGKTTYGRIIAEKLNMSFVDMDEEIERQQGKKVSEIFTDSGEDYFRELEKELLHQFTDSDNVIISTGGGVPCHFNNMEVMNRLGTTIYIHLTTKQLADNLRQTNISKRPILASLQNDELETFIAENLSKRESHYLQAHHRVSGTDEEIIKQILKIYSESKTN